MTRSPAPDYLRAQELDHDRRTTLVGIGLGVAIIFRFGRIGVERHQLLEHPAVHRYLDDRPACG